MGEVQIVNHGADTVMVNYKFAGEDGKPNGESLSQEVIAQLDEWQAIARKHHEAMPTPLTYRGQTLFIRPHGSGVWSWLLYSDDVKLSLAHGTLNKGLFCQARPSAYVLWMSGPHAALAEVDRTLATLIGEQVYHQMSELHLCVDMCGFDFSSLDWQTCFVSRVVTIRERPDVPTEVEQEGGLSPRDVRTVEADIEQQRQEGLHVPFPTTVHRRLATLDFGSHGSNISAQLYNKSLEVKKHRKEWMYPIWCANGWDGESVVWRWEFRLKRKFLAEFEQNEAERVLNNLEALWQYATCNWLRMIDTAAPCQDSNRSRLPLHPVWKVIQDAYVVEQETGATRSSEGEAWAREQVVLEEKPLLVLERAAMASLETRLVEQCILTEEDMRICLSQMNPSSLARLWLVVDWLTLLCEKASQTVLVNEGVAVRASMQDEPQEVIRSLAQEVLDGLPSQRRTQLIAALSPEPFHEVQAVLVKRERTMAKRQACLAGLVGYLRSFVAWSGNDLGTVPPDLLTCLLWVFAHIQAYDEQKGRSHREEVLKKQLVYGFVTAAYLDQERKEHGVDLLDVDRVAIQAHLDQLQRKYTPRRSSSSSRSDAA